MPMKKKRTVKRIDDPRHIRDKDLSWKIKILWKNYVADTSTELGFYGDHRDSWCVTLRKHGSFAGIGFGKTPKIAYCQACQDVRIRNHKTVDLLRRIAELEHRLTRSEHTVDFLRETEDNMEAEYEDRMTELYVKIGDLENRIVSKNSELEDMRREKEDAEYDLRKAQDKLRDAERSNPFGW
jgi:hypothetical protein